MRFEDVHHRYGSKVALNGLSFSLGAGGVTALLGPNGAGKTTALKILLGFIPPTRGQAFCLGHRPGARAARMGVAAMLQQANLPDDLTVHELLILFRAYYPHPVATCYHHL
ncbi:MAG: ATP-binding cassette domain-containing protein [Myxococcota bacterium]